MVILAGCSGGEATKAGGSEAPVTLRIGTNDPPGRPASDQIEEFARQVEDLSDRRIRIQPVWEAAGEALDDWDQQVARMIVKGELEMGMIPARAWDTEGVTSLRALQAPFLVTSDELVEEIVTSESSGEMLAGLERIGITGLALLPEGLRHVFSFGDPLISPDDFLGKTIRAPHSDTAGALFEALGATTDDPSEQEFTTAVDSGSIVGAESSFALALVTLPAETTVVGNVTLFPKVNSLVINTDRFDELSDDQRTILRDAARLTMDSSIMSLPSEAESAQVYCTNGGRVVVATGEELRALEQAVQPVYDELEQDEETRAMIDQIRIMSRRVDPAQTVEPCGPRTTDGGNTAGDDSAESAFPEGIYRMEMTVDFLMEAGVDRSTAVEHAGVWTLGFEGGKLLDPGCPGSTYSVEDGRVTIRLGPEGESCGTAAGKVLFSAGWTLDGDQLRFRDVQSGHGSDLLIATLFGGQPFTKIG